MKKIKEILLAFVVLLAISTLKPALAQSPTVSPTANNNSVNIYGNVDSSVPHDMHTLTQTTIIEVLSGITCALSGRDPLNPNGTCLGFNSKTGKIGYIPQDSGGVAQIMGGLIGSTMTIPISSTDYAEYAMSNFGIAKSAYAQSLGTGYSQLTPLIGIWSKFRDIAYLAFVLAFTIIGLAIMLRVKIDARTVMTIQNQIPKIVIALILVTFSYAIAGFLIDMMYVLMYLTVLTFNSIDPVHVRTSSSVFTVLNEAFNPSSHFPGGGIITLTSQISLGIGQTLGNMAGDFLNSTISSIFKVFFDPFGAISFIGCAALNPLGAIGGIIGYLPGIGHFFGGGGSCNFLDTLFKDIMTAIFMVIAFLVVLIAILYTLFKIWFTLIKSFIYVLVDSLIGPLWIAAGIFPGSKLGFGTWFRHLASHLSVFPMTFAVILLGRTIMNSVGGPSGTLFNPPLVGETVGGNQFLAAVIGFGFILSIPSILDRTRKAIGAIDFGLVDVKKAFSAGVDPARQGFQAATTNEIEYGKDDRTDSYVPKPLSRGRRIGKAIGIFR